LCFLISVQCSQSIQQLHKQQKTNTCHSTIFLPHVSVCTWSHSGSYKIMADSLIDLSKNTMFYNVVQI
jgi:hypothetical protein